MSILTLTVLEMCKGIDFNQTLVKCFETQFLAGFLTRCFSAGGKGGTRSSWAGSWTASDQSWTDFWSPGTDELAEITIILLQIDFSHVKTH